MLLNELKQIFEVDQEVLGQALQGLGIRTSLDLSTEKNQAGDVDQSFNDIVSNSIVVPKYAAPSPARILELFKDDKSKAETASNLKKIIGNLDALESVVTNGLNNMSSIISGIAVNTTLHDWISSMLLDMDKKESSQKLKDVENETAKMIIAFKQDLIVASMKKSGAELYGKKTIEQVKNLTSKNSDPAWFEADGVTPKTDRLTYLSNRVQVSFAVIKTMQNNALSLQAQFAGKLKAAPTAPAP